MHIARKELERLIKYSQGLGIQVSMITSKHETDAACLIYDEPPRIIIYNKGKSITNTIVCLLHELGHAQDWLDRGKPQISKVFTKELDESYNKAERETVKNSEYKAAYYMPVIAKKLDLKFPQMYKIKAEAAYDRWTAKYFYDNGDFPRGKICDEKKKMLLEFYKRLDNNKK